MALTAWEKYLEDRILEGLQAGSAVPNPETTKCIFLDYLDVDVTARWNWSNYEPADA